MKTLLILALSLVASAASAQLGCKAEIAIKNGFVYTNISHALAKNKPGDTTLHFSDGYCDAALYTTRFEKRFIPIMGGFRNQVLVMLGNRPFADWTCLEESEWSELWGTKDGAKFAEIDHRNREIRFELRAGRERRLAALATPVASGAH